MSVDLNTVLQELHGMVQRPAHGAPPPPAGAPGTPGPLSGARA
ncbi:hypothetical protein HNQ07_002337 [Deinococcus metalli]|uniref:Uncharacterized protein n=1 Tax=Deinococcus metalli TaxID=1141878 RepID=A0A7W8KFN5_9DEIO|nr:hypothetical protein [Deinococcus metalli]MBB5376873.1 hypothetical protein [Deinococcus metalli]